MEAVIFAGGRGKRCGALTITRNKGAIPFRGKPLLWHVLQNFCSIATIQRVLIVTGYRAESLIPIVDDFSSRSEVRQSIEIIKGPEGTIGNYGRLLYALPYLSAKDGCLSAGIDTIYPSGVIEEVVAQVKSDGHLYRTLTLSPFLDLAPTHYIASVKGGFVEHYGPPGTLTKGKRYRDIGLRFTPLADLVAPQDIFDWADEHRVSAHWARTHRSTRIRAVITSASWRHFGFARDFKK